MNRSALVISESGDRRIVSVPENAIPKTVYRNGRVYTLVMTMDVAHVEMAEWWCSRGCGNNDFGTSVKRESVRESRPYRVA